MIIPGNFCNFAPQCRKTAMKVFAMFVLFCEASPLLAYRDGARENSCYDHSIDHGAGTVAFPCSVGGPQPCRFFLMIREVTDEATLQLGGNEMDTYR
jgi:hypothetical protein